MSIKIIQDDLINKKDVPSIVFVKVTDALNMLWDKNPKLHDIGAISASIQKYGFQELPKYDGTIQAIVAGNGRIEALAWLERQGESIPRGIASTENGAWAIPVLIGVDQESESMAIAYAIDSNNLTLSGGDFNAYDFKRLWNSEGYIDLLNKIAPDTMPVSVSPDDLDMFISGMDFHIPEVGGDDLESHNTDSIKIVIGNHMLLTVILQEIKNFLDEHPDWNANIAS